MTNKIGGLIFEKDTQPIEVRWNWFDESKGIVQWTFINSSSVIQSGILFRASYPFGNAFWPIYEANKEFDTKFTVTQTPLVDRGIEDNSPPLAMIQNKDGSQFVAFLFTILPNSVWSMLEGGFSSNLTPNYDGLPVFIPAAKKGIGQYIITWDPEQCQGYNQQAGTSLPCPANPVQVTTSIFTIEQNVNPLFNDIIVSAISSGKPSCLEMIVRGIDNANSSLIIKGLECAFGNVNKDYRAAIKKRYD